MKPTSQPPRPTFGEMLTEVIDLSAGVAVVFLPLLVLSVPAIVLFVLLPAILLAALAAPLAALGAVIAAPFLLARRLRRRRAGRDQPLGPWPGAGSRESVPSDKPVMARDLGGFTCIAPRSSPR
jgi:hypothetical protein